MDRWSRRQFVQGVGVAGLGLLAGCSQIPFSRTAPVPQPSQVPHIGFLSAPSLASATDLHEAFRQGLTDYGYVEGRDILIEWRSAEGALDRIPALAAELVALQVALIVVGGTPNALAVQRVTGTIPIVVAGSGGDLVADGLAVSLAHPGSNVTGLSTPVELTGKSFQLLVDAAPGVTKICILTDMNLTDANILEGFGQKLGVQVARLYVGHPEELDSALEAAVAGRTDGLFVPNTPLTVVQRARIIALAAEHRLPAIYGRRLFVDDGGLMSYQPRIADRYRRAAFYVDRILKGATPADLPVEQPMLFDFVINLKTAQALGLTIPEHVLLQATEVIQ
jgi:putative ABC transport system substrate-binding protein